MALYFIYEDPIYSYFLDIIEFNIKSRSNPNPEKLSTAINLNIILNSACFLEGFLEDRGKLLLGYYNLIYGLIDFDELELRKPKNVFFNNIQKHLGQKISQSTGIDNYNSIFELLTGASFKTDPKVSPFIEGINVLYQFRNVIAHGRQIHSYEIHTNFTSGKEEKYYGGYKKTEAYLLKKGLISTKFKDAQSSRIYFTNEIADHFYSLVIDFTKAFDDFLKDYILIGDTLLTKLQEYNQNSNTDFDMYSFLRGQAMLPY